MKSIKNIFPLVMMLLLLLGGSQYSLAQDSSKESGTTEIQNILNEKKFTFVATSVTPARGSFRQLTSLYDLRLKAHTLECNLPYFGRAYSAPMDPTAVGFQFTSTSFDYTVKPGKKGSYNVSIKPKDKRDIQQLYLSVFANGTATLQVTSNSRQPIMYNGNLVELQRS